MVKGGKNIQIVPLTHPWTILVQQDFQLPISSVRTTLAAGNKVKTVEIKFGWPAKSIPCIVAFFSILFSSSQAQNTKTNLPFEGLCYSPFRTGQSPSAGAYPTVAQINSDLTNIIQYMAPEIRTYGMSETLSNIPGLCYNNNINCYPCAYLDIGILYGSNYLLIGDGTNQLDSLIATANANYPTTKGLIVGTETILNTTDPNVVQMLINCIGYVRSNLNPNIKVPITTAETWDNMLDWPNLVSNLDFIMVHIDPIWYDQTITNAVGFVLEKYQEVTNSYPGMRVVIGETGWPSAGTYSDPAELGTGSMEDQTQFLFELRSMLSTNNIECLVFEPFDELWKDPGNTNDIEVNWGVYYSDRTIPPVFVVPRCGNKCPNAIPAKLDRFEPLGAFIRS